MKAAFDINLQHVLLNTMLHPMREGASVSIKQDEASNTIRGMTCCESALFYALVFYRLHLKNRLSS